MGGHEGRGALLWMIGALLVASLALIGLAIH